MNDKTSNGVLILNIVKIVADTLVTALTILAFCWGAWFYQRVYMILFGLVSLAMYHANFAVFYADKTDKQSASEEANGST